MTEPPGAELAPTGKHNSSPSFTVWLKTMAEHARVADPASLHRFLMEHACHCTRESAAEWLSGRDPSPEKSRDIIKAFHSAFPDLDVWEEYKRFVRGEPYMQGKRSRSSQIDQTLDEILQQSGLPPGLTE